jgi:hypothetical protein
MLRTPSRNVGGANVKTAARSSRNRGPVAGPRGALDRNRAHDHQ